MKVCLLGDTHGGYDGSQGGLPADQVHGPIVQQIMALNPYMVFHLGDAIHNTASNPWMAFDTIAGPLITQVGQRYYSAFGNHDINGFFSYFTWLPTNGPVPGCYSVETDDAIFLVLKVHNASETPPNCTDYGNQIAWLEATLDAAQDKLFKFVIWHRPAYTTGARGPDLCATVFIAPMLERGVDMVFCGHIHAYERYLVTGVSGQLNYMVSGGAGGFPHALNNSGTGLPAEVQYEGYNYMTLDITKTKGKAQADMRAFDLDGVQFDRVMIEKLLPVVPPPKRRTKLRPRMEP